MRGWCFCLNDAVILLPPVTNTSILLHWCISLACLDVPIYAGDADAADAVACDAASAADADCLSEVIVQSMGSSL